MSFIYNQECNSFNPSTLPDYNSIVNGGPSPNTTPAPPSTPTPGGGGGNGSNNGNGST
jgi:hypothetical protein